MIDLAEHHALVRLHQAETTSRLGKELFDLVDKRMPNEMLFLSFLPNKFELPSLCSVPRYQPTVDTYMRFLNKYDIWLRRSPVGSWVKAVRHSDHTPLSLLKRTRFYRDVMRPVNSDYGASIVVWHGEQWLATLTVFRNARQGDLTDGEMEQLRHWQVHFEVAVQRLAVAREARLDDDSLATFIWGLPHSAVLLDWDLAPRHFNAAAVELCQLWSRGAQALAKKSRSHRIAVPERILAAITRLKQRVAAAKLARPGPLRAVQLESLQHPETRGLSATISFIPSKALTLSRGRFLVQFYRESGAGADLSRAPILARLTANERKVALEAARGLSNEAIGQALGKSPGTVKVQLANAFRKLNLRSRAQLASLINSSAASASAGASDGA